MVKEWSVKFKHNKMDETFAFIVKANTEDKARIYAIQEAYKYGHKNFHITSINEFKVKG